MNPAIPTPSSPHPDGPATHDLPPGLRIALVGHGRVAQALAEALARAGHPVAALGSRRAPAPGLCTPQQAVDGADLVLLTVPDDAIAATCAALRWRPDQAAVHCSGATEVDALEAAARAGARTGGFHPLQIFSDPAGAARRLAGSTVAVEAGEALRPWLLGLAARLGLHAIELPPGSRARYHAAAGYAASFLLPVLQEALDLWASFGVAPGPALQALLPLARGTLDAVAARGPAGALSGPIARGDAGVVRRHLAALETMGSGHAAFYRTLARPQLDLAVAAGRLQEGADLHVQLQNLLAEAPPSGEFRHNR